MNRRSLITPSYSQGFARSAGDSTPPGLRRGLVGAFVPPLGPSGGVLNDVSVYKNHGVLTNMTPATDWIPTDHGYALDMGGGTDSIIAPDIAPLKVFNAFSYCIWIRTTTLLVMGEKDGSNFYFAEVGGRIRFRHNQLTSGTTISGAGTAAAFLDGEWHCFCAVYDGSNTNIYADLVSIASLAVTGTMDLDGAALSIGRAPALGVSLTGQLGPMYLYNRAILPNEVTTLCQDRLAPFRRRDRRAFSAAPAGGVPIPSFMRTYRNRRAA